MKEIVERRFARGLLERKEIESKGEDFKTGKFSVFPDLIMIDGGLGQVNVVKSVLEQLGLVIPICGMVKDSKHRTRGLISNGEEIYMPMNSPAFKLIVKIQDEAHRFAITYHRSLRDKKIVKSVLDEIEGVGPARKKALLKHFNSI